ncbi:MAG TPA: CoA pyrophosphatase [Saprospiraceae bacterium]|jgi:8-oxo-dGTP pyrophosphatase MutT (NUDIX family)|nr:CoA pyrophosphatase [Saprospiraceae bacterium]HRO08548.1 CoA pyrophosphatase [Saprospiraceae bacterium]HRP41934.1 CoA pyrophosphatase [Saprospiraceae bacterium]
MDIEFIHDLEHRLKEDLPGEEVQNRMAPILITEERMPAPENHLIGCVLALLYPKDRKTYLALIERTSFHSGDKHAGQISFPGGKLEESDYSYEDCALRETYEEIGVMPESVGILGNLTPLYVPVSNFLIHPFIGFTAEYPKFNLHDTEVKSLIELPIEHILKSKYKGMADIEARGMTIKDVPYYDAAGKRIWGATAMIMSELEQIISDLD